VVLAQQDGYFTKYGLKVTLQTSNSGGPTIIPALLSGKVQFGDVGVQDDVEALAKGFKITSVGPYAVAPSSASVADGTQVVALKGSGITSAKQLEGKTVAINSLDGLGQLLVDADVQAAGGDYTKVKYVAINFPQMQSALQKHQADAAWDVEPFIAQSQAADVIETVTGADYGLGAGAPISAWTASASYVKANPGVVKKFQEAMNAAYTYADSNPAEKRDVTGSIVSVSSSILNKIALQAYAVSVPTATYQAVVNDIIKFGFVKSVPALSSWVLSNPTS
jgi:NitT/TauT family transport system substrate-binding protein